MKQWHKDVRGWQIIFTRGRGAGLGICWHGRIRLYGLTVFIGPLVIDLQPPMPEFIAQPNE